MDNREQKEMGRSGKENCGKMTKQIKYICGAVTAICVVAVVAAVLLLSGFFGKKPIGDNSLETLNMAHSYYETGDREKSVEYYKLLEKDTNYQGIACNNIAHIYAASELLLDDTQTKAESIYHYLKRGALDGNKVAIANLERFLCYNNIYLFEPDEESVDEAVEILVGNGRIESKEDLALQFVYTGDVTTYDEVLSSNENIKYTLVETERYLYPNNTARYITERHYRKYEKGKNEGYSIEGLGLVYDDSLFHES